MSLTRPERGEVQIRVQDGGAFSISGELDLSSEAIVRQHILASARHGATMRLDLSGLTFIDSSGINVLVQILHTIGPEGRLTIEQPSPFVRRVLQVAGLDRHPSMAIV
jgi:anti-anti-sigma factor